ncbi:glycosyltransferase family 2 protein [Oceaniglobus indicus]|uniref:glycosyltransferase family 2 protein n=1 Tax=Oceaniglobus indicus TaxID=2047749 RepID=UPI000C18A348|nr:glycosyltransferase [Oceaniglobus indicus]
MTPRVSVVVVSRDRPAALARCLRGLDQLLYPTFEVIVVADPPGAAVARAADLGRVVAFDLPNISAARNAGIAASGGDIVAFIDDDAVPEPTWLTHLVAPFDDPSVALAGGFVIGRNGISFQWRARSVDATGVAQDLSSWGDGPKAFDPPDTGAIKTEGTNMAARRDVLCALGGFDAAFAFFLDETDLNMRAARAGFRTALVPLAQVHHGFAASARRRADRAPLSLFDIGASSAVFWNRHLPVDRHAAARAALVADQRARIIRHLVAGTAEPRDVPRLMQSLNDGLADGARRGPMPPHTWPERPAFRQIRTPRPVGSVVVAGRRAAGSARARIEREKGLVVTLLDLSPSALYHRCVFDDLGIWRQSGGIWGRSDRRDPIFMAIRRRARIERERKRIFAVRGLSDGGEQ